MALRGGPEHAYQKGTLMEYVARSRTTHTRLHGIQGEFIASQFRCYIADCMALEATRFSPHSRAFKLQDPQLYRLVVEFCNCVWPRAVIFGPGEARQLYLPPEGAVRNYSYVEHDALRYGSYLHTYGRRACYGYVNLRLPVRIERILYIEFPDRPDMRTICMIVRRFQVPQVELIFPWSAWQALYISCSSNC